MGRERYVGREPAVAAVHGAVQDVMTGEGKAVLLVGEPGIGKTALAREASRYASEQGVEVAWATCWDGAGAPPYWPWVQVLRVVSGQGTPLPPQVQRIMPQDATTSPQSPLGNLHAGADDDERVMLFDAVSTVLFQAARRNPLLVVVDDLQWADVPSLLLLRFFTKRIATAPLLLLGLFRDAEVAGDEARRPILADLRREADLVTLVGLPEHEVSRMVVAITGTQPEVSLVTDLHRRTGGNPFFVREVVQLMMSRGGLRSATMSTGAVPQGVQQVLEHRLARLPQACVAMLVVAAVAGRPVSTEVIARAAGITTAEIAEHITTAVRAGVITESDGALGAYGFTHDLFRESIYDAVDPGRRAEIHGQLGDVLEGLPADAGGHLAELARHYLAAASGPPSRPEASSRAVRASLEAASEAQGRYAFEASAGLCTRALDILGLAGILSSEARADMLLARGEALVRAGEPQRASRDYHEVFRASLASGDAERLAMSVLGLHSMGVESGASRDDLLERLEEARRHLADERSTTSALVLAALARELFLGSMKERPRAARLSAEAIHIARKSGDDAVLARCLLAGHDTCWLPGTARRRREIAIEMGAVARRACDRAFEAEACLLRASASLELADPQALMELREFDRLGTALGQPHFTYLVLTRRAMVATLLGRFTAAEQHLAEAAALAEEIGEPDAWNVETRILWELRTAQGRRAEARAKIRECALPQLQYWFDALEGLALLQSGRRAEAERLIVPAVQNRPDLLPFPYVVGVQWAELGEGAAACGMPSETRRFYDALLPHAGTTVVIAAAVGFTGAVDHHLGRLAASLARFDQAVAHFERAEALHQALSAWPWLAHTRVELSRVLTARGHLSDRLRAASLLDAAAATAYELGMPGLTRQIERDRQAPADIFVHEGDIWRISFRGNVIRLRDVKGLGDIATLLRAQGAEVAATTLVGPAPGSDGLGADPVLDRKAKQEYRSRLRQLDEHLNEADRDNDMARSEALGDERAFLIRELSSAVGLGDRDRRLGDDRERARKAVTARIKDALQRVAVVDPVLGSHLTGAISTGNYCSYKPAEPVHWDC